MIESDCRPDRYHWDEAVKPEITRVWNEHFQVYGARKVCKPLKREAIHVRGSSEDLIHPSDRGSQYLSIRYSKRLAEGGITDSVGRVGDSYDNALAKTINGLYKTDVIRKRGPWRNVDEVEAEQLSQRGVDKKRALKIGADTCYGARPSIYR